MIIAEALYKTSPMLAYLPGIKDCVASINAPKIKHINIEARKGFFVLIKSVLINAFVNRKHKMKYVKKCIRLKLIE